MKKLLLLLIAACGQIKDKSDDKKGASFDYEVYYTQCKFKDGDYDAVLDIKTVSDNVGDTTHIMDITYSLNGEIYGQNSAQNLLTFTLEGEFIMFYIENGHVVYEYDFETQFLDKDCFRQ